MIFDVLMAVLVFAMVTLIIWDMKKQDKTEQHVIKLAMKVAELEDTIQRVDESTGRDINRLGVELRDFRESYGDAAVEEMRQAAKAQKAWADGVNNIMNFGAQYQSKGDQ